MPDESPRQQQPYSLTADRRYNYRTPNTRGMSDTSELRWTRPAINTTTRKRRL